MIYRTYDGIFCQVTNNVLRNLSEVKYTDRAVIASEARYNFIHSLHTTF